MTISKEEIAARSYSIWEQEGRPEGKDLEHWLQAERELSPRRADRGRAQTTHSRQPLKTASAKGRKAKTN